MGWGEGEQRPSHRPTVFVVTLAFHPRTVRGTLVWVWSCICVRVCSSISKPSRLRFLHFCVCLPERWAHEVLMSVWGGGREGVHRETWRFCTRKKDFFHRDSRSPTTLHAYPAILWTGFHPLSSILVCVLFVDLLRVVSAAYRVLEIAEVDKNEENSLRPKLFSIFRQR